MKTKPPQSDAIAACWEKFRRDILGPNLTDVPEVATSLSQASFYFGALAALELIENARENAQSAAAIDLALDAYRDEIMEHIEQRTKDVH